MAEVISVDVFNRPVTHRFAQYMDGRVWKLEANKDFKNRNTAINELYTVARKMGGRARVKRVDDAIAVMFVKK